MSPSIFDNHLVGKGSLLLNLCFINIYYVLISIQNICSSLLYKLVNAMHKAFHPFCTARDGTVCDT